MPIPAGSSGAPAPQDVAEFLGKGEDAPTLALAQAHLPVVSAMVKAYTRGRGFDEAGNMADDLALVVIASTARLVANPDHTRDTTTGPFSIRHGIFDGWTLPELAILHSYRRRSA